MSFLGALTGSDAKKYANQAAAENSSQLSQGYTNNQGYENTGYTNALARFSPYAQTGQQANTAYGSMLGLNGAGAQQNAFSQYQQYNPMWNANLQNVMQAQDRRAAATGQFNSGINALARGRIAQEQANANYQDYMTRLGGLQQQGLGVAQAQAGLDTSHSGNMQNIENAFRSGNIQNSTNKYNALSAANQAGFQNMLGLGSLGISAFMPTATGQSAFGNFSKMFSGFGGGGFGGGANYYGKGME